MADLITELSRIKTASSLFSFWDRLFGTLRLREDPRTLQYGLEEFDPPKHQTLAWPITPFRELAKTRPPQVIPRVNENCPEATRLDAHERGKLHGASEGQMLRP